METSVGKDEKREKQKFIFRLNWICACSCRKCGRSWEYLEVPIFGGKGWRRAFSGAVSDFGGYVWFYFADN